MVGRKWEANDWSASIKLLWRCLEQRLAEVEARFKELQLELLQRAIVCGQEKVLTEINQYMNTVAGRLLKGVKVSHAIYNQHRFLESFESQSEANKRCQFKGTQSQIHSHFKSCKQLLYTSPPMVEEPQLVYCDVVVIAHLIPDVDYYQEIAYKYQLLNTHTKYNASNWTPVPKHNVTALDIWEVSPFLLFTSKLQTLHLCCLVQCQYKLNTTPTSCVPFCNVVEIHWDHEMLHDIENTSTCYRLWIYDNVSNLCVSSFA